jgi:ergothioneine biosynthesis protein EgtB
MTGEDTDLRARYCDVRSFTEWLAAPLSAEDQTIQSMADVSPTKWHRAHTTWFFETFVLAPHATGYVPPQPEYAFLFNSYYEAVGPRHPRPERGLLSRPGVEEIAAYRRHVDATMAPVLDAPSELVAGLVELGLHHEQQHQELLLMDIKHVLGLSPLQPIAYPPARNASTEPSSRGTLATPPGWLPHAGGTVSVGHAGGSFAFDNEFPRHDALLRPFAVSTRLVTCGEWMAFVDDGGYRRPELWMSDGWAAACAAGWQAPLYWRPTDGAWEVFTLHGPRPVVAAEPVCHVSWYEADAFARWAGCRLPSEAEWEQVAPDADPHVPFALHPGTDGWYGTVWQWTASPYGAYPGYRPASGAVGEYNGKFMVNQQVLRGSACVTPTGHARRTYRNFFPPSARWPFAGLRLCRDG